MDRMTDDRLEKLLAEYYESEPSETLTYRPEEAKKPVPITPLRMKRIAAAASLVLVTALSVGLYFFFGNKSAPLLPAPSSQSAAPSELREESGGDILEQPTEITAPTESPSPISELIGSLFPKPSEAASGSRASGTDGSDARVSSTTAPTTRTPQTRNPRTLTPQTRTPQTHASESQNADDKKNTRPTEQLRQPTEKPEQKPTEALSPRPTEKPTEKPTEPPNEPQPTIPCAPPSNDPTDDPISGDEPGLTNATEGGAPEPEILWLPFQTASEALQGEFLATFESSMLNGDGLIYCKIYDFGYGAGYGRLLGSQNQFDESHAAVIIDQGYGLTTASYSLPEGLIAESGYYKVVFYNSGGKAIVKNYFDI